VLLVDGIVECNGPVSSFLFNRNILIIQCHINQLCYTLAVLFVWLAE
jgi:hypothetical protein